MATYFNLGQLFGGQLFELFACETNLKKQSSVLVEIGLSDLPKSWGTRAPRGPPWTTPLLKYI